MYSSSFNFSLREKFILFFVVFFEVKSSFLMAFLKSVAAELKLDSVIISGLFYISIKPLFMVCSLGVGIILFFWEKSVFIWEKNIKKTIILDQFMSFNLVS